MSQDILDDRKKVNDSSIEDLLKILSSNASGLTSKEAKKRLEEHGPNEITEKRLTLLSNSLNISGDQCHGSLRLLSSYLP